MSCVLLLRLEGKQRCGRLFPPLVKGGQGGVGTQALVPLTRPAADLSPRGRGEENSSFPQTCATNTADRPRPNGERVGVRGLTCSRSARRLNQFLSGTVGMVVTSALVFAQAHQFEPTRLTNDPPQKTEQRAVKTDVLQVEVQPPRAVAKQAVARKARLQFGPANLENQVQQYLRQARPIVRAELIFVRKVCELDMELFRRVNRDAEAAFKDVAKSFVEAQQQGRARVPGGVWSSPAVDGLALLHEGLASVMKKHLTPEQFAHYQAEVDKRDANRKQSAVRFLIDAIDRDLYLSGPQRSKLNESLLSHWEESWSMSLEYLLYGNQFYPVGIDPFVTPFLDATQKRIWQGTQKVGGIGGVGGVLGGFNSDTDALEVELGEERKATPANIAPNRRIELRQAPMTKVETKKAVAQPAATPKK